MHPYHVPQNKNLERERELKVLSHKHSNKSYKGFTLVELLIVISILAALAAAVVVVINPAEMLRQGRDATRMGNIGTLHRTLSMFQIDRPGDSMGSPGVINVSIPSDLTDCDNLGLPPIPGWVYRCVTAANLRNINGTGWIPINFTTMSRGSPLSSLPVDPINTVASGAFYVFVTDGRTWNFASLLESERHAPSAVRDGGTDSARFEAGTNPSLWASASGLVGYWSFDGTGSIANNQTAGLRDGSGRENHGTASNANATGMAFVPGRVNNAVTFDGVDDHVEVPNSASLNITSAITIEAWVRTTIASTNFRPAIVSKGEGAYLFTIGEYVIAEPKATGFLRIAGTWHFLRGNTSINDGSWHHVVMTYDGQRLMIYRNGISDAPPLSVAGNISVDTRALQIGSYATAGARFFNGLIDEVRIHNRALTEAEIRATFNATR